MVSPRKEHSGATKALRKWHKRCRDPKKSADDILDLALKALDDAHGGGRAEFSECLSALRDRAYKVSRCRGAQRARSTASLPHGRRFAVRVR